MSNELAAIPGLRWEKHRRIENGVDSWVVPFPTCRPVNVVFHGEDRFDYGHYGIHVGQEDRLTFLGPSSQKVLGLFLDCRANSPALHTHVQATFTPSSARALCIPPGVAHAFDGLEHIYTINEYRLYLPDPERWVSGDTDWNVENDVINMLMDAPREAWPKVVPNPHWASELFYQIVGQNQRRALRQQAHEYPFTQDVRLEGGDSVRLLFRKQRETRSDLPQWNPIDGIAGLGWAAHLLLASGPQSGFVPLVDPRPFYVVDHGEAGYSHDAFGIHLGQVDHLTFLGSGRDEINVELVDCREGSPTLHCRAEFAFAPSPLRCLVIPNGVAHRFHGLERVFTINRPEIRVDSVDEYAPANDVVDWPRERRDFPIFRVSANPVEPSYYVRQAVAQREYLSKPAMHTTPIVLLGNDAGGESVRIVLRKQATLPNDE